MPSTSPDRSVRIMLADDHALVREAFRTLLEGKPLAELLKGDPLMIAIDFVTAVAAVWYQPAVPVRRPGAFSMQIPSPVMP